MSNIKEEIKPERKHKVIKVLIIVFAILFVLLSISFCYILYGILVKVYREIES